jgi:hypothetical protein
LVLFLLRLHLNRRNIRLLPSGCVRELVLGLWLWLDSTGGCAVTAVGNHALSASFAVAGAAGRCVFLLRVQDAHTLPGRRADVVPGAGGGQCRTVGAAQTVAVGRQRPHHRGAPPAHAAKGHGGAAATLRRRPDSDQGDHRPHRQVRGRQGLHNGPHFVQHRL